MKQYLLAGCIATAMIASCASDDDSTLDAPRASVTEDQSDGGGTGEVTRKSDDVGEVTDSTRTPLISDLSELATGDLVISAEEALPASAPLSLINGASRGFETSREAVFEIDSRAGDCMRSKGFEYWPQVSRHAHFVSDYSTIGQQHEHAQQYGYGIYYSATEAGMRETQAINDAILAEDLPNVDLTDAYRMAYIGLPDTSLEAVMSDPGMRLDELGEGCLREAIESYRADHGLPELADDLLSELNALPYWTSSEIQASVDQWIECMAEAGIEADSMNSLELDILSDFDNEVGFDSAEEIQRRFEEERSIAVTDVLCDWKHALPVRLQLEYDYIYNLAESFPELAPFLVVVEGLFE